MFIEILNLFSMLHMRCGLVEKQERVNVKGSGSIPSYNPVLFLTICLAVASPVGPIG